MKLLYILASVFLSAAIYFNEAGAVDRTFPDEIVEKVRKAADVLAQKGEAGLAEFNKKDGEWVWKDTYIFVVNCEKDIMAAHPIEPSLVGKTLSDIKDKKGNVFNQALCAAAKKDKGGWVEYWWTKPGAEGMFRKISYAVQVKNLPYQVGAGVYDDQITLHNLEWLLE